MKFTALNPLRHDGKDVQEGDTIDLDKGRDTDRLVELGAIEPARGSKSKGKDGDAAAADKAAAEQAAADLAAAEQAAADAAAAAAQAQADHNAPQD